MSACSICLGTPRMPSVTMAHSMPALTCSRNHSAFPLCETASARCWIPSPPHRRSSCHPAAQAFPRKRELRRSELAASISIFLCNIVHWEKRAGARAPPRTSAVPDCCSRPRNGSFRTYRWRLAWCCRQKLPGSPPPKSSAAEKWSAPSKRKDKDKDKDEGRVKVKEKVKVCPRLWPQRF